MIKDIEDLLKNIKFSSPTFFQLQFFVIGKEATNQAKLHKCLQEIKERCNTIKSIELEIEELQDANSLFNLRGGKLIGDLLHDEKFQKEECEIRVRQIKRKIQSNDVHVESLKEKINTWMEEIKFLKHLYDQIVKHEPLKPWDNYDVQLEYWSEKMAQEIKSRLLLNAPVDMEIIKTALALPDQAPIKKQLLEFIDKKQ